MIADVDAALSTWLRRLLPDGTDVVFDPPEAGSDPPTLYLLLHEVREDPEGAPATQVAVRNGDGQVVGRQPIFRRYRLTYLMSAWADGARAEHELLGQLLTAGLSTLFLPPDCLSGQLAQHNYPVMVQFAPTGRALPSLTGPAGQLPTRTSLDMVVLATLAPAIDTNLAPPAQRLDLQSGLLRSPSPTDRPRRSSISEGR